MFQSQTGFPGHLALCGRPGPVRQCAVSIPDGLPRPFSHSDQAITGVEGRLFQSQTGFPGHLAHIAAQVFGKGQRVVSIPDGLPRPFSQAKSIRVGHWRDRFNPRRASQAI